MQFEVSRDFRIRVRAQTRGLEGSLRERGRQQSNDAVSNLSWKRNFLVIVKRLA